MDGLDEHQANNGVGVDASPDSETPVVCGDYDCRKECEVTSICDCRSEPATAACEAQRGRNCNSAGDCGWSAAVSDAGPIYQDGGDSAAEPEAPDAATFECGEFSCDPRCAEKSACYCYDEVAGSKEDCEAHGGYCAKDLHGEGGSECVRPVPDGVRCGDSVCGYGEICETGHGEQDPCNCVEANVFSSIGVFCDEDSDCPSGQLCWIGPHGRGGGTQIRCVEGSGPDPNKEHWPECVLGD